jgi:hypothetical protein
VKHFKKFRTSDIPLQRTEAVWDKRKTPISLYVEEAVKVSYLIRLSSFLKDPTQEDAQLA